MSQTFGVINFAAKFVKYRNQSDNTSIVVHLQDIVKLWYVAQYQRYLVCERDI